MRVTRISCPFCGEKLWLHKCPVVATWPSPLGPHRLDEGAEDGTSNLPSRRPILYWIGEWPVISDPSLNGTGRIRGLPSSLRRADADTPQDLPARICEACTTPLPDTLGELDAFSVAVVGLPDVGKTTFIAALLREALERDGLHKIGCAEFSPTERTAREMQTRYLRPFDEGTVARTLLDVGKLLPLEFRVRLRSRDHEEAFALLVFDIAGESIADKSLRYQLGLHVFQADSVIFLLSALGFPALAIGTDESGAADIRQVDFFGALTHDIREKKPGTHIAVVLSKSDLLQDVYPAEFAFLDEVPRDSEDWARSIESIQGTLRHFLEERRMFDLLRTLGELGPHSLHACSCLIQDPTGIRRVPRRVLDPLAASLGVSHSTFSGTSDT